MTKNKSKEVKMYRHVVEHVESLPNGCDFTAHFITPWSSVKNYVPGDDRKVVKVEERIVDLKETKELDVKFKLKVVSIVAFVIYLSYLGYTTLGVGELAQDIDKARDRLECKVACNITGTGNELVTRACRLLCEEIR